MTVQSDETWNEAFRRAEDESRFRELRDPWMRQYAAGALGSHADDEFYDVVHSVPSKVFMARLDAVADRKGRSCAGLEPRYSPLPPFERRWTEPARKPKPGRSARESFKADALRDIESGEFYEVLTGRDADGRVQCPAHDDSEPSCLLNAAGLWHCFACKAGGTIYEMAACVWGEPLPLRGPAYGRVRDRLKEMFGVHD